MSAQAFVLAAGFGTRLRPLTHHRPKPLLPVAGVPVLDQALALCHRHGLSEVVVNAHHLHEQVRRHVENRRGPGGRLRVHLQVEQPEILGTGGGVRRAEGCLDEAFVVLNGDVLCDAPLAELRGGCGRPGVQAVMLLRAHPQAARYGRVLVDGAGTVVRLVDLARVEGAEPARTDTHFTGIHALRRTALEPVPPEGRSCVVRTAYRALVPRRRVRGLVHEGAWYDIGNPADYLRANRRVLADSAWLPLDPWERAGRGWEPAGAERGDHAACRLGAGVSIRPPVWVGRGARVEPGVRLGPEVVVGERAVVGRGARLSRTVVWSDGRVEAGASLAGAVVHDGGVLQVEDPLS